MADNDSACEVLRQFLVVWGNCRDQRADVVDLTSAFGEQLGVGPFQLVPLTALRQLLQHPTPYTHDATHADRFGVYTSRPRVGSCPPG